MRFFKEELSQRIDPSILTPIIGGTHPGFYMVYKEMSPRMPDDWQLFLMEKSTIVDFEGKHTKVLSVDLKSEKLIRLYFGVKEFTMEYSGEYMWIPIIKLISEIVIM